MIMQDSFGRDLWAADFPLTSHSLPHHTFAGTVRLSRPARYLRVRSVVHAVATKPQFTNTLFRVLRG